MSYDLTFVATNVFTGMFPDSARPFVLEDGTLQNTSYVTIPRNATNVAGALVVANLLLEPDLQAVMANPQVWGMPTVLDLPRVEDEDRTALGSPPASQHVLEDFGEPSPELPVERVLEIDERWRAELRQ